MDEYLRRATAALARFQAAVEALDRARAAAAGFTDKQAKGLRDVVERLRAAVTRLEVSLSHISGDTALDVVDLQQRLEGETAALAAGLKALGGIVNGAPAVLAAMRGSLYDLEESAERVSAAIFPSTIEGVREINRTLWDFRLLWAEYTRTLASEVARPPGKGLTSDQMARLERTADHLREQFDRVNDLLNQLVIGAHATGGAVQALIREARTALAGAVREAKSKASDVYKPFHGVLKRTAGLAARIDAQFRDLRVPVFPDATGLAELSGLVDAARYRELTGVERFALLNIAARLRSIAIDGGGHLLSPQFAIRVFDVFPDRVYLTADASFITAVEALRDARVFEDAPASLHRFNQGSFKQRQARKGNLQVSYAFGSPEQPDDRTKVRVDADIDLYRSPTRHLFGEVLVNHLTGSRTDQFKVWDILASSRVAPIGAFDVVTV